MADGRDMALCLVIGAAVGGSIVAAFTAAPDKPSPRTEQRAVSLEAKLDALDRTVRSLQYDALKLCAACTARTGKECCEHIAEPKP